MRSQTHEIKMGSFRRKHVFGDPLFPQEAFPYIAPPEVSRHLVRRSLGDGGFFLNVKELNGLYTSRITVSSQIIGIRYTIWLVAAGFSLRPAARLRFPCRPSNAFAL